MDAWFQALMVQAPRIYGAQLLPLSLAHVYILKGYGSPYALGTTPARTDLHFAIAVCSRSLADNRRMLSNPRGAMQIVLRRSLLHGWRNFSTADASFRQYLADYMTEPRRGASKNGKRLKGPWEYHAAHVLASKYHMGADDAWDCPVGLALCRYSIYAESQGDESLLSSDESAADDLIAEAQALTEAGKTDEANAKFAEAQAAYERANNFSVKDIVT